MPHHKLEVATSRITLLDRDGLFGGLGTVEIAGRQVRSGRLPWLPYSQTIDGFETCRFRLLGVRAEGVNTLVVLEPWFRRCPLQLRRDRNLTQMADTGDWSLADVGEPGGELRLILAPATQGVEDCTLTGFSYQWRYNGPHQLHHLLDRSSWELDGDIRGATACSQTGWTQPVARFHDEAEWSTELGHELQAWPRWAVMQGFDFQAKPDGVLCGLFERVGLIRSILRRETGAAELKVLDNHVGDAATEFASVPKRILFASGRFTERDWQNLWSGLLDAAHAAARAAYGLREVPAEPYLQQDFWSDHTYDDYRRDLLPAAAALGLGSISIGNVNRNAASECTKGNQCCSHAYEPAPRLGGSDGLRRLVADARALGLRLRSWTSTAQGFDSPVYQRHRNDADWFLRQEDGGQTNGSVHDTEFHCLNLAHPPAVRLWVDALLRIRAETGLDAWFLDMFPNVSFMPLHHAHGTVTTIWRQCLLALAELQRAGIDCDGGSPAFVRPLPGGHDGYGAAENAFINHRLYVAPSDSRRLWTPGELRRWFAQGVVPTLDLRIGGQRIDRLWTPDHRRELDLFRRLRGGMHRRTLIDGGVRWRNAVGRQTLIFAFEPLTLEIDGQAIDQITGSVLPAAHGRRLAAGDVISIHHGD